MNLRERKAAREPQRKRIVRELAGMLRTAAHRQGRGASTPLADGIRAHAN
jgi:hypothetical protein